MELQGMHALFRPQVNHIGRINLYGFRDGAPPNIKLWELAPIDATGHPLDAATLLKNPNFFPEHIKANTEQIEATKKSFDAPSGLILIHGGPSTGKTTLSILQALTAASVGHKDLICAPSDNFSIVRDMFHKHKLWMAGSRGPRIYVLNLSDLCPPGLNDYDWMILKLAMAQTPSDDRPIDLERGIVIRIQENRRTLKTPGMQALYKDRGAHDPTLEPLIDSQTLNDLILKLQHDADPDEEEVKAFKRLYNKLYFPIISGAAIIISPCFGAGARDLIQNFRPTVAIVDDCNLAADGESFLPLLLYDDVRIRILIGDKNVVKPHTIYDPDVGLHHETRLLERWGSKSVPVYELHSPTRISRNKPYPCGSRKKHKKCCGIS